MSKLINSEHLPQSSSFKRPETKRPRSEVLVTKSGNFLKQKTRNHSPLVEISEWSKLQVILSYRPIQWIA